MAKSFRVGILGAGGFTGQELIKIFNGHTQVQLEYITSSEYADKSLSNVFPWLAGKFSSLKFSQHPVKIEDVPSLDYIFLAVPDEVSLKWAGIFLKSGIKVIDISGSFRLTNTDEFSVFYKLQHTDHQTLSKAVYGLTELNREKIKTAELIANPGCYPTAALVPLIPVLPILKNIESRIIIDAKSGTSGAGGRKEKDTMGYSTVYENFRTYRTVAHQHMPEIRQIVKKLTGNHSEIRFTPHLLPMYRGILSVSYLFLADKPDTGAVRAACEKFAQNETFVRFYESPDEIELKNVQHTNFTDFSFHYDEASKILEIVSGIDNLVKGAAGQAVQNMNLMAGLAESEGLL
jgi:N-acetyl-gamma-glutamyl-phosphate reductase